MKHIKRFELFEMAMGVPEGNVEMANLAYQRLLKITDGEITELLEDEPIRLKLLGQFKINDFEFNTVSIDITVSESDTLYDQGRGPELTGMSFKDKPEIEKVDNKFFFKSSSNGVVSLGINIAVPFLDMEPDNLREFLKEKKVSMVASLSHEFKHAYDTFKKPISNASDRTEYVAIGNVCFGIKPIDDFFYQLYFTTTVENLVRPSELAGAIDAGEIDKEKFMDFLKDNRTHKQLKQILEYVPGLNDPKFLSTYRKNYTPEELATIPENRLTPKEIGRIGFANMKSELSKPKVIEMIKKRLDDSDIDYPSSDKLIVDFILELAYDNLKHEKINTLHTFLMKYDPSSILRLMLGQEVRFEYLDEYIKKISYENHKDFFENEIKRFIFVSDKVLKKLSKLYDMAKDLNVNPLQAKITAKGKKNESILDWELWQEINGIKPNIKNIK
jgi:hypothetical protein